MSLICSINTTNHTTTSTNLFAKLPPPTTTLSFPSFVYFLHQPYHHHHHHHHQQQRSFCTVKTGSSQDSYGPDLLRKPIISPPSTADTSHVGGGGEEEDSLVESEDQILEDTVPLVGFVRMILHSGIYRSGERLSPAHETTILEKLLPYHPESEKKIGCGIDYITIGYHPQFEESRCLFIMRKDGVLEDFSYWKCIKGFIRKNYPQHADSFILKHFRRRRRYD